MNHDPLYPRANTPPVAGNGPPRDESAESERGPVPPASEAPAPVTDVEPNAPLSGVASILRTDGGGVWRGDTGMAGHDAAGRAFATPEEVERLRAVEADFWSADAKEWHRRWSVTETAWNEDRERLTAAEADRDAARAEVERYKTKAETLWQAAWNARAALIGAVPQKPERVAALLTRAIDETTDEKPSAPVSLNHPPCAGCEAPDCDAERQVAQIVAPPPGPLVLPTSLATLTPLPSDAERQAAEVEPDCPAITGADDEGGHWECSKPRGHDGDHAAFVGVELCATWPKVSP